MKKFDTTRIARVTASPSPLLPSLSVSLLSVLPSSLSLSLSRDRYARARELSSPVYTSAIISRTLILALFTAYNVRVTHVRSRKRTIGPQSKAHGKRLSIRIDWQRQRDIFTRAWAPNVSALRARTKLFRISRSERVLVEFHRG